MRVAVVGLGLIGGSLLRALAAAGHEVTGFDADPATREAARTEGFRIADSVAEVVAGSELTALAVPLTVLPEVIPQLAGYDGLVTDVTSVKGPVRDLLKDRRFVGGHPMAGRETSGFAASEKDLFDGCAWVLCLEPHETDLSHWLTLARLFTGMGARVVPVTAAEHDTAAAQISHVPHLFAAALAEQIVENPLAGALGAGSFRDGTRVAATRPELTAAMCGGNRGAVRRELHRLIGVLEEMSEALEAEDPVAALTPRLRMGAQARRAWPATPGQATRVPAEVQALLDLGRSGGWVTSVGDTDVVALRPESDRKPS
ncbi:putative prephenate dehydrogenase [Actinoplanes missouriensis 431]|uniref:Putative prephenate dehydrogenase n=1 Tax=Actinoplanes missouriensis (strain ATCC 14538 / DSM 43046 / CBS 188.64 / JCM 3121 / NBRC 102363 / NCIMB 12654 / NRRL B-3342 / UNCC 431) TaxID=512565 RepID=I0HJ97_ACTM4|nr:prephenate dehydrogenase/arogenate dehydrogenase family protein [Actinoplanes missouriensis]BAL93084.1 putative prephenate dehydrogenase [Actinoplanes missouriensis 431]